MGKSLIAFDTDHIKRYVFGTDKLKEIRGASSWLDYLNRIVMEEIGVTAKAYQIYANGGSGLFLLDKDEAEPFGQKVQRLYREVTAGGSSITYVVQDLPRDVPTDMDIKDILEYPLGDTLELLRYRLREAKDSPAQVIALPSQPFMRVCDACGVEYAEADPKKYKQGVRTVDERNALFCANCIEKRSRDDAVKDIIEQVEEGRPPTREEYLWVEVMRLLQDKTFGGEYEMPPLTERPQDFNIFRNFKGAKDYFGLIYADGNSMGKKTDECKKLGDLQRFSSNVDTSIYEAVCLAIKQHLQIKDHLKEGVKEPTFPFDILLLGGDDVLIVTPATVALAVANTIAREFRRLTKEKDSKEKGHTLSVGVVLAPVKYPFGSLLKLVESTLKSAKKAGAKARAQAKDANEIDDTRINFMTVTGSTSDSFEKVYTSLSAKDVAVSGHEKNVDFYATLRPYDPEQLDFLLKVIREGNKRNLGRTKLHQVREAVLKKNLTTSVSEGLAVLRNWKQKQRSFVLSQVYEFGGRYQMPHRDEQNLATWFPRVTFPWFADGEDTYRTSLLDFVELYDFVAREEGGSSEE